MLFGGSVFIWSNTVAGSQIRRSPVEVGSLSHYLQGLGYIPGGHQQYGRGVLDVP